MYKVYPDGPVNADWKEVEEFLGDYVWTADPLRADYEIFINYTGEELIYYGSVRLI